MKLPTKDDLEFFLRNGVVCLRNFLLPKWISLLEKGFEQNIKNPGPHACFYTKDSLGLFRDDYCNWQNIAPFREVIFASNLAAAAASLLNARQIRFFHEHIFFKQAGTIKKTPWHQDLPYYCVDGDQGISFWIPLTDIDTSNKIEFIAGSHKWNKLYAPKKFNGVDSYSIPQGLYEELPNFDSEAHYLKLSWTMNVSDVLAFDFRTIHGNTNTDQVNLTDRKSVALRFLGENMRYSSRPGEKSPPFPGLNLNPGDQLDHQLFPIVWMA